MSDRPKDIFELSCIVVSSEEEIKPEDIENEAASFALSVILGNDLQNPWVFRHAIYESDEGLCVIEIEMRLFLPV